MTQAELKKLHELELVIAREIQRICNKYGIRYFLLAGSVLGAVRHHGFIPWDEDMDFGMLRSDFRHFVEVCKTELDPEKFFLQTAETDSKYAFAYAKLRLNGTHVIETFSKKVDCHNGIYVDIFPFDPVPVDQRQRRIQARKRFLWKNLLSTKLGYQTGTKRNRILQILFHFAAWLLPLSFLRRKKAEAFEEFRTDGTENIVTAEGSYGYEREIIPARYAKNLIDVPFETETFSIFSEYENYLTAMYGDDWMCPSNEISSRHEIERVLFGEYT